MSNSPVLYEPDRTTTGRRVFSSAARACPELATAAAAVKQSVCAHHIADMRAKITSASSLSADAILDDLEMVIDALIAVFLDPSDRSSVSQLGPGHAAAREGQNFSLAEVYSEYVLFRRNLEKQVRNRLCRSLSDIEVETFQTAMEEVVAASINSFTRQRDARLLLEATALTDFLSSLAHDVRNELNGLLMSLQIAEINASDLEAMRNSTSQPAAKLDQLRSLLREMHSSRANVESTLASLGRVLEADRIGTVISQKRPTELHPLMEGIARSAERIERAKLSGKTSRALRSRIKVECSKGLIAMTDPDLLSTILTNVMGNAVKYSEQEITFRARVENDRYTICVIDSGPGMGPDQCAQIFGKFDRAGRSDNAGMGLGLFIANKAAQVLGASLTVDSRVGAGTCVSIEWASAERA